VNDVRFNWSRSEASQTYEQDTYGGAVLLPDSVWLPSFADGATSLLYLTTDPLDDNTVSPGTFSRNIQRQYNIVNTLSWIQGSHSVKFGFDYRRLAPSIGGRKYQKTLSFGSITELASGLVPTADLRQLDVFLEPRFDNFSAFLQDAWKLTPQLTLTYGLRWDVNPAPGEANGQLPPTVAGLDDPPTAALAPSGTKLYATTYNNFAPRLGIAYQPFTGSGTVIRGGFGVFYDLGNSFTGTALTPTMAPYSRVQTLRNVPLSDERLQATVPEQDFEPPYGRIIAFYEGYELPYSLQYSVGVEQPFGASNTLALSYVGSAGRRLARVESLRPNVLQNPLFTRIDAVSNDASSDYHSLQVQFRRRVSRGLQTLLAYTWGKSLDTASDESQVNLQAPAIRVDPDLDRGPSSFDIRHSFTGSASYEFPSMWSSKILRAIAGGWGVDTVVRLRTEPPVNVVTGRDPLSLGLTTVARPDLLTASPLYLEDSRLPGGKRINPAAFDAATPLAQNRQGTLGRNVLRGFGLRQVDLSLRRHFRLTEGTGLQVRADAFNVLNTPNFAAPTGVLTSPNFGRATQILSSGLGGLNPLFQIGGPRSMQLALKFEF
jgi:hypothetical protein